jgi:hypothetical protein
MNFMVLILEKKNLGTVKQGHSGHFKLSIFEVKVEKGLELSYLSIFLPCY